MHKRIFIYYDDTKRCEPFHGVPMTSAKIRRFPFRVNPLPGKSCKKINLLGQATSGWAASPRQDARRRGAIDEFRRLSISLSQLDKQVLARCVPGVEVRNSRGRFLRVCRGRQTHRGRPNR